MDFRLQRYYFFSKNSVLGIKNFAAVPQNDTYSAQSALLSLSRSVPWLSIKAAVAGWEASVAVVACGAVADIVA